MEDPGKTGIWSNLQNPGKTGTAGIPGRSLVVGEAKITVQTSNDQIETQTSETSG